MRGKKVLTESRKVLKAEKIIWLRRRLSLMRATVLAAVLNSGTDLPAIWT